MKQESPKQVYENLVELKYQLYNSLFLTLPLDAVEQTGLLLPLLEEACQSGLQRGESPQQIMDEFLQAHRSGFSEQESLQFLFKVIQYVERQVVLVDALEDAAFSEIHRTESSNRLSKLIEKVESENQQSELADLLDRFGARVILTAHPTQFYPGPVLGIITDLTQSIKQNNIGLARDLLQQLGNTPFFQKEKPTPLDEATQLSWYLGNIFYHTMGDLIDRLADVNGDAGEFNSRLLSIGFWPGGDRDGNPFVTTEITRQVSQKLRHIIISSYHQTVRDLKRRLSFAGVYEALDEIEVRFHLELTGEVEACFDTVDELLQRLEKISTLVDEKYQGLFLDQLASFKRKLKAFGFHFASLDIRQDSRVLADILVNIFDKQTGLVPENFDALDEEEQINRLLAIDGVVDIEAHNDPLLLDTIESLQAIKDIQARNDELACHRYIISNCRGARDIANLIALFRLSGWTQDLSVDIVPLFETVNDLRHAGDSMAYLYRVDAYRKHLVRRRDLQTVMLGFSDGTKDGGYLMANWAIYRAKEDITSVSRAADLEVAFFDGRGGPPARGGGSTYKFYSALGKKIESNHLQLTIQGQSISSYYGTPAAAQHNLGQLLAAGIENNLYDRPNRELGEGQRELIETLAKLSYEKYVAFKQHPLFLPYLEEMSTLHYYGQSNIGSRPSKRGGQSSLRFEDLRAIPFVGAWGQLKQNVPGYFGLGSALKALEERGQLEDCQRLYRESTFFEALIGNSMQSMSKANFKLTAYMEQDLKFGEFWKLIHEEYKLSLEMVLKVSGQSVLLEDNATSRYSISLRQRIVLPLLVIQQYALMKLNTLSTEHDQALDDEELKALTNTYEKMVIRSLFGNINASRNSA